MKTKLIVFGYFFAFCVGVSLGWTGRGEKVTETVVSDVAKSKVTEKEVITIKRPSGEQETRVITRDRMDSSASKASVKVSEPIAPRRWIVGISQGMAHDGTVAELMVGYRLWENVALTASINNDRQTMVGVQFNF